jgi:hypothetical protein
MLKPLSIQVFSSSGCLLNIMMEWCLAFVGLRLGVIMRVMASGLIQWLTYLIDPMV